ncbi:hypothetical protein NA57DRAFT_50912 [Rhizodiscina lignyota]|uniref:F-box domain-containing protein n=1 Tax=Rhizodiscina lignyota TaxID=1504668 RepID=A0A9P4ME31_9PEZI|nr:hypothetical protein NA57DRAFT_50912 [Rhizodiscina lignyota]
MLADLPFELLSQIALHLPTAQSFYYLSLTCRRLCQFVAEDGWRTFAQHRFPSIPTAPHWKEASHALSTLSRNWDRRALAARYIHPDGLILRLPEGQRAQKWQKPQGQSMGFQPVIDAYEEWASDRWASRREVLTFSAGAELLFRIKDRGLEAAPGFTPHNADHRHPDSERYPARVHWVVYKPPEARQGLDDVTCLRLLRSLDSVRLNTAAESYEKLIFGTAKGDLKLVSISLLEDAGNGSDVTNATFATNQRPVRSMDLIPDGSRLATCLSDSTLALYPVPTENENQRITPSSEVDVLGGRTAGPPKRLWSTRWLSSDRLAVGLGPCDKPLHVYQVTESGLDAEPIRKFGIDGTEWGCDDRIDLRPEAAKRISSVYPIVTLPATSEAGHAAGNVFLTGCYDGIIRLHDLRSPHAHVSSYWDPIDDSAIYSLQAFGRERLAAGSAQSCAVKFFDLRVSGGRAYHYLDIRQAKSKSSSTLPRNDSFNRHGPDRRGWNLFLAPRPGNVENSRGSRRHPYNAGRREAQRAAESPIYSLCSPAPYSPSLFAGIENNIVQIDFTSTTDKHPDPLLSSELSEHRKSGHVDQPTWDSGGRVVNLAMYEHTLTGGIDLKVQVSPSEAANRRGMLEGYDDRWRESPKWRR